MRAGAVVASVILLAVGAGCAGTPPVAPAPAPVAAKPTEDVTPPAMDAPAPSPEPPKAPTPPKAAAPVPAAPTPVKPRTPAPAVTSPSLDFTSLENRLRATKAIGVFTKLALKNQIDDLLQEFKSFHQGRGPALTSLRERYDLLLMKVLSLLQNDDASLARDVSSSREQIWGILVDPVKFAKLS
jgi:hypothetical protein